MNMFTKRLPGGGKLSSLLIMLLLLFCNTAMAFDPAKGLVTDASGKPLEGVTVSVKGKDAATTTSVDGTFSIDASKRAVLLMSYIGFEDQQVQVAGGQQG